MGKMEKLGKITFFWDNVKRQSAKKGITQEKLSKLSGLNLCTLRGWMSKGIWPVAIDAYVIARALDVTVEYLITGQEGKIKSQIERARSILKQADEKLGGIIA